MMKDPLHLPRVANQYNRLQTGNYRAGCRYCVSEIQPHDEPGHVTWRVQSSKGCFLDHRECNGNIRPKGRPPMQHIVERGIANCDDDPDGPVAVLCSKMRLQIFFVGRTIEPTEIEALHINRRWCLRPS